MKNLFFIFILLFLSSCGPGEIYDGTVIDKIYVPKTNEFHLEYDPSLEITKYVDDSEPEKYIIVTNIDNYYIKLQVGLNTYYSLKISDIILIEKKWYGYLFRGKK